ncbi:MAG TPA: hypothetical protein VGE97_02040 [Nitrososphaera sp.]
MMYSETDVHSEGVMEVLTESIPDVYISSVTDIEGAEHPTSVLVLVDTDDRRFKVTVTTEEIDASSS